MRMTRAAAAAAAIEQDLDTATKIALPGSPALGNGYSSPDIEFRWSTASNTSSALRKSRILSGREPEIVIALDATMEDEIDAVNKTAEDQQAQESERPGTPTLEAGKTHALMPKTPAMQVLMRDKKGMRSTSNKENVSPGGTTDTSATTNTASDGRIGKTQRTPPGAVEQTDKRRASTKPRLSSANTTSSTKLPMHKSETRVPSSEVIIPHSKPRPMSLSFPTPPPPAKSTRPPTRPTFALPGDAVAARLKANREARQAGKPEASATAQQQRTPFKARPVPKTLAEPAVVRQTKASQARQSLAGLGDRRASLAGAGVARQSASRLSLMALPDRRASVTGVPTSSSTPARRPSPLVTGTQGASTSSARVSSLSTRGPDGNLKTERGKEVFKRAAQELAEQEKKRKEKEEAAKKARADAAERGRLASQAWAERQRAKMGGGGGAKKAVAPAAEDAAGQVKAVQV